MTLYIEQFKSPHFEDRKNGATPRFLILHYSGCEAQWMHDCFMGTQPDPKANNRVSAHYVVQENGHIHQYVHEEKRAWHAGLSYWDGETDLNSASIGIEMINLGDAGGYPPFAEAQVQATIALCLDILKRHPGITPFNVLGHSDIAPGRKLDPGPAMPWQRFADAGVGVMPTLSPSPLRGEGRDGGDKNALGAFTPTLTLPPQGGGNIEETLTAIGYNPGVDLNTRMTAFCQHYAPEGLNNEETGAAKFSAARGPLLNLAALKAEFEKSGHTGG